jgi:hypothetical protein
MPEEKSLSLNGGEEKTPSGNAQPGNNAQESVSDDDIEKEIDTILSGSDDDDDDDDDDDTIVLPKKQVEKLKANLQNYKEGLLSVKDKLKHSSKGKQAGSDDSKKAEKKPATDDDNTPITKADIRKGYEKEAINKACEDEEINDNWTEIIKFYTPRHGKDSVEAQLKNILEAKYLWEKDRDEAGSKKDDKAGDDKKSAAELAAEKAKQAGTGSGGKTKESKHVLPTKTPIKDWYPKKDA